MDNSQKVVVRNFLAFMQGEERRLKGRIEAMEALMSSSLEQGAERKDVMDSIEALRIISAALPAHQSNIKTALEIGNPAGVKLALKSLMVGLEIVLYGAAKDELLYINAKQTHKEIKKPAWSIPNTTKVAGWRGNKGASRPTLEDNELGSWSELDGKTADDAFRFVRQLRKDSRKCAEDGRFYDKHHAHMVKTNAGPRAISEANNNANGFVRLMGIYSKYAERILDTRFSEIPATALANTIGALADELRAFSMDSRWSSERYEEPGILASITIGDMNDLAWLDASNQATLRS